MKVAPITLVVVLSFWCTPAWPQDPDLKLALEADLRTLRLGQETTLRMRIAGTSISRLTAGSEGVVSANSQVGAFVYEFRFKPQREGKFTFGPYQLSFNGRNLTSNSVALNVLPAWNGKYGAFFRVDSDSITLGEMVELVMETWSRKYEHVSCSPKRDDATFACDTTEGTMLSTTSATSNAGAMLCYSRSRWLITPKKPGKFRITRDFFKDFPAGANSPDIVVVVKEIAHRPIDAPPKTAPDASTQPTLSFRAQQKHLFSEIDHKLVYQGCQELMRRHREGKLAAGTYFCDEPGAKPKEVPESLRALRPTFIRVDETMLQMAFRSEDGTQYLQCLSNELGEPAPSADGTKGYGFRTNPFGRDELSGTESLDYLNANYQHFEVSLIPGLSYLVAGDEPVRTLAELKRRSEAEDAMSAMMREAMNELAVKQQRLLYRTDHQELLKACREAIRRFRAGVFSTDKIDVMPEEVLREAAHIDREAYARDLQQIPKIILDLQPVYLWFEENNVMVALMGGLDHAGVSAYMNDSEAAARDDDMKLVDGLRYYDDGLREGGAEYREYLKSLEHEALTMLDWRRKQMNLPLPGKE